MISAMVILGLTLQQPNMIAEYSGNRGAKELGFRITLMSQWVPEEISQRLDNKLIIKSPKFLGPKNALLRVLCTNAVSSEELKEWRETCEAIKARRPELVKDLTVGEYKGYLTLAPFRKRPDSNLPELYVSVSLFKGKQFISFNCEFDEMPTVAELIELERMIRTIEVYSVPGSSSK
jgi:hypothetical protein